MKSLFELLGLRKLRQDPIEALQIQEKAEMIQGINELPTMAVKEIMVPRIDVNFIAVDASSEEVVRLVLESGHSRYPVYTETIDNVIGILYAKDLLRFLGGGLESFDMAELLRKPYYVPESMRLDALLREMKKRRVHIAVVVDEYGGVSGIVCMEDILEEIIGDIQDEFDNERDDIIPIGGNVFLCDARSSVDDINERLELDLPLETSETLGGFVFDLLGKIPARFEKVSYHGVDFIIQDMEGHKIRNIKLVKRKDERSGAEA